jgi:hypothetical protein
LKIDQLIFFLLALIFHFVFFFLSQSLGIGNQHSVHSHPKRLRFEMRAGESFGRYQITRPRHAVHATGKANEIQHMPQSPSTIEKYYESSELDTIPAPIHEWNIDRNQVERFGLTGFQLVLTIWVDDQGVIDRVFFDDQAYMPVGVDQFVNSIKTTLMAPATRSGSPVRCVITFAITLGS